MQNGITESKLKLEQHIFRKSLPLQRKLQEIARTVGNLDGLRCVDVGTRSGMFSFYLRRLGGEWCTVAVDEKTADNVRAVVENDVYSMSDEKLPFENKDFDLVILHDCLERVKDDELFVQECHRILKPDGRFVINARHARNFTLVKTLRRILNVSSEQMGLIRPGYTESQLFHLLKHGFDVLNVKSFSRVFVELVDVVMETLRRRIEQAEGDSSRKLSNLYTAGNIAYKCAFQFDMLLFFARGYELIAIAKRRAWLPRKTPVLVDGRSISEAVLSRPSA